MAHAEHIAPRFTIKHTRIICGAVENIKVTYGTLEELNFHHDCNASDIALVVKELNDEEQFMLAAYSTIIEDDPEEDAIWEKYVTN